MALCPRQPLWRILGHSCDVRGGVLQDRQYHGGTGREEVSQVYEFRGGPLDGQQRTVFNRYSNLPPQIYECRVQEPLTLAASWEAYQEQHPVPVATPPIHRYVYALEHDCYKYLGAT